MTHQISRRVFIKQSGTIALGFAILPKRIIAPSDKLRIAHIGLGGMGNAHMNWFANLPEVDIVALCDVDQEHLDKTYASLQKLHPDTKAERYKDFRRVLERKDIDAISVATPDHWHGNWQLNSQCIFHTRRWYLSEQTLQLVRSDLRA